MEFILLYYASILDSDCALKSRDMCIKQEVYHTYVQYAGSFIVPPPLPTARVPFCVLIVPKPQLSAIFPCG